MLTRQSRCQCANPRPRGGSNPYAETALMRHAVKLPLTPQQRKALIAASISHDPQAVLKFTEPLRRHQDPLIAYAANLVAAHNLAKISLRRQHVAIARLVRHMRQLRDKVSRFPTSDVDFFVALLADDNGNVDAALRHLDAALQREPTFFNAAVLAVKLRILTLARQSSSAPHACLRQYGALVNDLTRLLRLEPCPRMAAHAEVYLSRWFERPEKVAPLAAAQVYLSIMAWDVKRARAALARFVRLGGANACTASMARDLKQFIDIAERQLNAD